MAIGRFGSAVDRDADEIDRCLGSNDAEHGDGAHQHSGCDQHACGGDTLDDLGKGLEVSRKAFDDWRKLENYEVGC